MGSNQRYRNDPRTPPAWAATVGDMKANNVLVFAKCDCGFYKRQVDYDRIIEAKGPGFSLFDCRPPCPEKCGRRVLFCYSPGRSTPTRPCTTRR